MYTCANCGTNFDGRVCPRCCTMRPAAAVLGRSGQIVKNQAASTLDPGQQAAQFADDLEYSRQVDAWRQEQQRRADEMRQRAAQLAQAAERQQKGKAEKPVEGPVERPVEEQPDEESIRYAIQAQKAVSWTRKAPASRASVPEEGEIQIPEALRSLRIGSKGSKPAQKKSSATLRTEEVRNTVSAESKDDVRVLAYPAVAKIPERKGDRMGRVSARSEKIDNAWRAFASGKKAGSDAQVGSDPAQDSGSDLPKPPSAPRTKK